MAAHVAPWLHFASDRVAGELLLWLPVQGGKQDQDLDPPVFTATRSIHIRLRSIFRLRPPVAGGGAFAALRCIAIYYGTMDGLELGALVSSLQCPCLEELSLMKVRLAAESDISICSNSLKRLRFHVENSRRLVVAAPELLEICVSGTVAIAHIAAPKLADVELRNDMDQYELAEAGNHIQRLVVYLRFPLPAILRRFDTIGELVVIQPGREAYIHDTFTNELRKLESLDCESLVLRPEWNCHVSSMLHFLRICNGLKKFVVNLSCFEGSFYFPTDCPCIRPESYRNDNVALDSLEEVEINGFTGEDVNWNVWTYCLIRCNTPLLKGIVFRLSPHYLRNCMSIIQDKIRGMLPPDIELRVCLEHQKTYGILMELNLYS